MKLLQLNNFKRRERCLYKYSYLVLTELETKGISKEILDDLLISHIIESELFENTLNLINYLYFAQSY